jgi:glutaredoxin 3
MTRVVLHTIAGCGFCVRARMLLEAKNADFEEIDMTSDPVARRALIERTGHRTFPQVFIAEEFVGGSDELHALERSGRLDALLA